MERCKSGSGSNGLRAGKRRVRAMDMIEDAIRKKGRANFYMDSCVVALEAFAEVKANRKKEFQVIRQYCYE